MHKQIEQAFQEMDKAVKSLFYEVPGKVADDIRMRWELTKATLKSYGINPEVHYALKEMDNYLASLYDTQLPDTMIDGFKKRVGKIKDAVVLEPREQNENTDQKPDKLLAPVTSFIDDLRLLIRKHSRENLSNTPDFIIGYLMIDCLSAFERASIAREQWYGISHYPGGCKAPIHDIRQDPNPVPKMNR